MTVDYIGWFDDGTIFDTSNATVAFNAGIYDPAAIYAPLSFIAGNQEVIQGFDDAVTGMKVGESKNITIEAKDAYGEYDPSLVQPVNMSVLQAYNITPEVGDTLYYNMNPVTVVAIPNNTTVMIDFNGPMAGKRLHFSVTVVDIERPAATPKSS
ncbi:MAG: FKBP-type peptidyl-prolyl cis-trans isomerase [Methanocella sp. PtaU1.Bin125]|nr:MAG: FKBP-type peptidyl-prolyl cis-trans isomerase [Methanocella sp. PtaU1.Bin125]